MALRISPQTRKIFNAVIGAIAINLPPTYTDFPENITSNVSIIMGHMTVLQNGSDYRICQNIESGRKSISDRHPIIVQQLQKAYPLSRASANVLTFCWTTCSTIVEYRSEMLFHSLSFCLFTESVLRTVLHHYFMAHDDGGFWCSVFWKVFLQESEKDGDRTMNVSFEPLTRLICFMKPNVEFKTLPTLLHRRFLACMLALVMVVFCTVTINSFFL